MRRYQLQSVQYLCSSYTFTFLLSSQWITEMCAVNFQAQKTVAELQAQLDLLKDSSESPQSDTEDVAQLKVRNGYNSVLLENSNHCLFVLFKLNKKCDRGSRHWEAHPVTGRLPVRSPALSVLVYRLLVMA